MILIVGIIASYNETYNQYKKLWILQIQKIIEKKLPIKFYFLYNKNNSDDIENNKSEYDLFFNNYENFKQGIYLKTIDFFKYLQNNSLTSKFILRCNLSSFFYFEKLLENLLTLPTNNLLYCTYIFKRFPSGCGFIFSYDLLEKVINYDYKKYKNIEDDVIFGHFFKEIKVNKIEYEFYLFEEKNKDYDKIIKFTDNFHFRTKHPDGILIFNKLFNYYYKIN